MILLRRLTCCFAVLSAAIVFAGSTAWADGPKASPEKEKELLAILRSEAPGGEKALACKHLAINGSSAAVPELAKLLSNPQLASWARIALEVIPGPEASEALRKASETLEGKLLVGTINSIGVRRDDDADLILANRLQDKDPEVAAAAAVALGNIGNPSTAKILQQSLTVLPAKFHPAIAEGCILCAESMLVHGHPEQAVSIYDDVRKANVPRQRILEATRGAILARKPDAGIALLLEQFKSPDKGLFNIGLSTAREFPGAEVDKALAAELGRAAPDRAALIVQAMADRKETVILAAVLKAAGEGPKPVRIAAIGALSRVGDASCLSTLLASAIDADADLAAAAKAALAELQGDRIDAEIVALIPKAEGKMYPLLIELIGQRRIEATSELLKALEHSDKAIRSAALTALGETVSLKELPILILQVVAPKNAEDAAVALQALKAASVRMPDREACAAELTKALQDSPAATKSTLLEILGDVGGATALKTIGAAAKSDDPQLQDVGSRLLGKWNGVDAAPVLLDLAKTAPGEKFQVRALRGYIGLARKFAMPEEQRADMCQKAFDASKQAAEQKLVLDVLKLHPSIDGLKLAIKAVQIAELKAEATQTALAIGQKLGGKPEAKELLSKAGLDKGK